MARTRAGRLGKSKIFDRQRTEFIGVDRRAQNTDQIIDKKRLGPKRRATPGYSRRPDLLDKDGLCMVNPNP